MMKKLSAIAMLGIFLVSIICALPVTAAHQKDFLDRVSSMEKSIEKLSKTPKAKEKIASLRILQALIGILKTIAIWILMIIKVPIKLMVLILNAIIKAIDVLIVLLS